MLDTNSIADNANIVVNGYAFTTDKQNIKVINLNKPTSSAIITAGEISETSMDDIELDIVMEYFLKNKKYIGV